MSAHVPYPESLKLAFQIEWMCTRATPEDLRNFGLAVLRFSDVLKFASADDVEKARENLLKTLDTVTK